MKVTFRVDASSQIGTGHLMRCLTLADALKSHGAATRFVYRHIPDHLAGLLEQNGHPLTRLPEDRRTDAIDDLAHSHWLGTSQAQDANDTLQALAGVSGNHNQSLDRALAIVEAAAQVGAHALKLQTYTADTMTLDLAKGEFFIDDPNSLWKGNSLYELYQQAYTPWEWHEPIFDRARELGLIAFSTPFDETAVDFLETLDVPCYKIASFENTDIPLIRKVAATGKPMIISTTMANFSSVLHRSAPLADVGGAIPRARGA